MKKIKSLRLASILLIGTLLTTCILGGTFAKYTTSASGSSDTVVAKWSFLANGKEIAVSPSPTVTFGLFDTVCDDADGDEEDSDIKAEKIAPGSGGKCRLLVSNTSDVSAKYSISFDETNKSELPIQYSLDNETWVDLIDKLPNTTLTDQVINYGDTDKDVEYILYWRWVFDGTTEGAHSGQGDATDSSIGFVGEGETVSTIKVTATITASQVD